MKFRKIVSAISALAMSASLFGAFATVGEAATTLYEATYDTAVVDWTAGSSSISWMEDGYVKHTGSGSGNRGARAVATTKLAEGIGKVSFDFNISDNYGQSGRAESQIALGSGSESLGNSKIDTNNSIFSMTTPTYAGTRHDGTYYINGDTTNTVTISYGTWYTITATVDMTEKTAAVVVAPRDGGDAIYNATNSFTASSVGSIYSLWPRSGPAVYYDNFKIEQLAIPAFTLSAEEAELELNETTNITVSDIVGDITVESSDSSIATASYDNGIITITGAGDGSAIVTVTATKDGLTETKEIIVRAGSAVAYTPEITSVAITGDDITSYAELQPITTYTATVLDQREAEMPGEEVVWSVSPADNGVTVTDGIVTVANDATAGTYTVTATSVTNNSISASKNVTIKNVRDITYSGVDIITPFGGYVSESTETGITKQQIQGETIVMEYDIYVPTGDSSSFTFYNSGNLGTQYIFNDSDGDGWVTMQYVTGSGGAYNINSSDSYTGFYADHWIHIKFEIPVTGNPGLGNTTVSASTVDGDTGALNGGWRLPYNNRTISARNLGLRALNKIVYSGTATVTNLAMYTKAANVTVDAPNATVSGIEEGYIAQNTYTATVAADLGYEVTGVTVDGEAVTANEDGTYSIVVDADGAAIVVTTTALENTWVFEEVDFSLWENANIFFTYNVKAEDDSVSSTTTDGILFTEFLTTYTTGDNDLTQFSGEGEINFAIVVLEDAPGYELTDVYLKQPQATAAFMSGEFEADAEIDESEYLELDDDMSFDIE